MTKIEEARTILKELRVPEKQQSDMCCYVFLALANIKKRDLWAETSNEWIRIHDVIAYTKDNYGVTYAENSRDTIRKQPMHHFRNAAFIEDNGLATNSPNYRYKLTDEALRTIQQFGINSWGAARDTFLSMHESFIDQYVSKRTMRKMPVRINGTDFTFSPDKHNALQKAIIEELAPRFAPNSKCLYVRDTIAKDLVKNEDKLLELGFEITLHDKIPDVVLYSTEKNWLFFIESVTSVSPMKPKRIKEIKQMTANVTAGKVYVTDFLILRPSKSFLKLLHGKQRSGSLICQIT